MPASAPAPDSRVKLDPDVGQQGTPPADPQPSRPPRRIKLRLPRPPPPNEHPMSLRSATAATPRRSGRIAALSTGSSTAAAVGSGSMPTRPAYRVRHLSPRETSSASHRQKCSECGTRTTSAWCWPPRTVGIPEVGVLVVDQEVGRDAVSTANSDAQGGNQAGRPKRSCLCKACYGRARKGLIVRTQAEAAKKAAGRVPA